MDSEMSAEVSSNVSSDVSSEMDLDSEIGPTTLDISEYAPGSSGAVSLTPKPLKEPVHDVVMPNQETFEQLLQGSCMEFAPGLAEVLQSSTPPSLDVLESLPSPVVDTNKIWGVYLLVLEKHNSRPAIYIGPATNVARGLRARWQNYDKQNALLSYIEKGIADGYQITHKGLLCWSPTPDDLQIFHLRSLFLTVEATFAFTFWAMKSRTKTYCMPAFCPWPLDIIEYDGFCSHSFFMGGC